MDTMKVIHKPTGETRMIKAYRFNQDIHKMIETYRDPNGNSRYTTIITSEGELTKIPQAPKEKKTEKEILNPEYTDLARWEELKEKGWKNLNKEERKEYKKLKKLFTNN